MYCGFDINIFACKSCCQRLRQLARELVGGERGGGGGEGGGGDERGVRWKEGNCACKKRSDEWIAVKELEKGWIWS
jgi:hypothetical protein